MGGLKISTEIKPQNPVKARSFRSQFMAWSSSVAFSGFVTCAGASWRDGHAKIESLAGALEALEGGTGSHDGVSPETKEYALPQHRKPDHAGRRAWFQHRLHVERDARCEYLAIALSSSED